jgi:hypothetical protein
MNYKIFLLPLLLLCFVRNVHAQEEIYQPTEIMDTLEEKKENPKIESRKQNDDARTELEKKKERLGRLRIGGNFGLQFGDYTYVNISPTAGYMVIKNRLEIGGGPIFIYERYRFSSIDKISWFIYGPDVYTRGYLWKGIFLEARYDGVYKPSYYDFNKKIFAHHLLLGGGYAASMGKIGSFYISALFNVINNNESIYKGTFGNFPLILGFGFGFNIGGRN